MGHGPSTALLVYARVSDPKSRRCQCWSCRLRTLVCDCSDEPWILESCWGVDINPLIYDIWIPIYENVIASLHIDRDLDSHFEIPTDYMQCLRDWLGICHPRLGNEAASLGSVAQLTQQVLVFNNPWRYAVTRGFL